MDRRNRLRRHYSRYPPLRDVNALRKIVKKYKKRRMLKGLVDRVLKLYNKETILFNENLLKIRPYYVYPNYKKEDVKVVNTYQVGGYE